MGEAAALASAACWAVTSVVMARLSVRYGGAVISGMRFLIASPFVIALMFLNGSAGQLTEASWITIAAIVASACIGYGVGDTMYVRSLPLVGLQRLSPTATALWVAMSAAGGVLLLHEHATWALMLGGAAIVLGVYLVVSGQMQRVPTANAPRQLGMAATTGVLLLVAGCWSVATLLLAAGRGNLDALAIGALRIPAGGVTIAVAATIASKGDILRRLPSRRDLPLLAAIGIGGTAVGSLLYIYAIAEAGVARATILNSTSPLMVVPLSMAFLGERPTALVGLGTAVCLTGTLLVVAFGR